MHALSLTPLDLAISASLVLVDAVISIVLRLKLQRQLVIAAFRMVIQLVMIGFVLRFVFALNNPAATLIIITLMILIAGREVAARPEKRFHGLATQAIGASSVAFATLLTAGLALTTAIRPTPWFDPHYAVPLTGIILGNVLNASSLSLDSLLSQVGKDKAAIEARLALGETYWTAMAPLIRASVRRGLLPIVNQMSAAGLVTLPGIMTGQILAGLDPMEAVKYQILLMFLLSGGAGLSAVAVAYLASLRLTDHRQRLRLDRLTASK